MSIATIAGKTCLVTGANSGIGRETALGLAQLGAHVIMACRSKAKGERAKEEIIRRSGSSSVDLLLADLSSLQEVRSLAREILERYERLHVLVNNAGLSSLRRHRTTDGFELTFAVNYLAPFLLTNLLLDLLTRSAPSRIVNVSSVAHYSGQIDLDRLGVASWRGFMNGYAESKLALILFTNELARRLQGTAVTVNCLHPGVVATSIWRLPTWFTGLFLVSARKGAETSIFLAASPEVEGVTGKYFENKAPKSSSRESYDEHLAGQLWDASARLVGLSGN